MAAYRQRLAERIDKELQRRGEDATDLAYALKINPRTAERWVAGTTEPQRRLRKPIADYFDVAIEELWPDLEGEERALRDQLDRIESKLDALLQHAGVGAETVLAPHHGSTNASSVSELPADERAARAVERPAPRTREPRRAARRAQGDGHSDTRTP